MWVCVVVVVGGSGGGGLAGWRGGSHAARRGAARAHPLHGVAVRRVQVAHHLGEEALGGGRPRVGGQQGLERLAQEVGVEDGEQLAVRARLRLVVVHAVLAGQRLDEALERGVAPHVVARPDRLLHAQQHGRERGVERLQVVRQLVHHRPQRSLCTGGGAALSRAWWSSPH